MSHSTTPTNQQILELINKALGVQKKDYDIAYRPWDDSYTVRFPKQAKVRGYLTINKDKATFTKAN